MKPIRTFIAVDVDKHVRERIVNLQEKLAAKGAAVNWVEAGNLHLTLLFLGEVAQTELMPVCRAVAEVAKLHPAFTMGVETVGAFPNVRRPRILWVGVSIGGQELVALHDALEAPLLELGCYRREDRIYTPHLTLGRVKADVPEEDLGAVLVKHAAWSAGQTAVTELRIMGSELTPSGPVYTVLGRAKLAPR
jgi:2'-5' RNA ligase